MTAPAIPDPQVGDLVDWEYYGLFIPAVVIDTTNPDNPVIVTTRQATLVMVEDHVISEGSRFTTWPFTLHPRPKDAPVNDTPDLPLYGTEKDRLAAGAVMVRAQAGLLVAFAERLEADHRLMNLLAPLDASLLPARITPGGLRDRAKGLLERVDRLTGS